MLSCVAARAFAGSLLERRLNGGRDGEVPQVSDVVQELPAQFRPKKNSRSHIRQSEGLFC